MGAYSVSGERTFLETAKEAMDEVLSKRGDSGLVYPAMRIISRKNHPISWFIAYVLDWLRYQFDDGTCFTLLPRICSLVPSQNSLKFHTQKIVKPPGYGHVK